MRTQLGLYYIVFLFILKKPLNVTTKLINQQYGERMKI